MVVAPGFYNGRVGEWYSGNGNAADQVSFFNGHGFLNLNVTADRKYSATLRFEGQSLRFKGGFAQNGYSELWIPRKGKPGLIIRLTSTGGAPGEIVGQVISGARQLEFSVLPSVYDAKFGNNHPLVGRRYTMLLPTAGADLGHGYSTMSVAANGTAKFVGKFADGTKLTMSSRIVNARNDAWVVPIHSSLSTNASGMVWGDIDIYKVEASGSGVLGGYLQWLRPANWKLSQGAFLKDVYPAGQRYMPPQKGISLLSGPMAPSSFVLTIISGFDSHQFVQSGIWPSSNKPMLTTPVSGGMTVQFSAANGLLKGSFTRVINGKFVKIAYEGLVFTAPVSTPPLGTLRGGGFFSKGNWGGTYTLE